MRALVLEKGSSCDIFVRKKWCVWKTGRLLRDSTLFVEKSRLSSLTELWQRLDSGFVDVSSFLINFRHRSSHHLAACMRMRARARVGVTKRGRTEQPV